jgi:hypothetical protein
MARICRKVSDAGVDLEGAWGFGTSPGKGEVFLIPQDPGKLRALNLGAKEVPGFYVGAEDKRGAMSDLLDQVAKAGISLHAVEVVAHGGRLGAYIWADKHLDQLAKLLRV